MEFVNEVLTYLPIILTVLGAMAFIVSIIVQVTKEVWLIKRLPTKIWTLIVSVILCNVIYMAYISYVGTTIRFHYLIAIIISGFPVSYIATYGWDSFNELYKRFKK
jgi:hypothetical protein